MRTQGNIDTTPGQISTQYFIQNWSKFDPTSAQTRSKNDTKSLKNHPKISSGADLGPEDVFEQFFDQFWLQLGAVLGAKLGSCWDHVGQKIDFWRFPKACKNEYDFQHLSGPSWNRFWNDLGVQNRTKIGPRSVSRAIMKQMQRFSKSSTGAVFLRIGRIEKRSKSNKKSSSKRS